MGAEDLKPRPRALEEAARENELAAMADISFDGGG
jgi:hypothetical protein